MENTSTHCKSYQGYFRPHHWALLPPQKLSVSQHCGKKWFSQKIHLVLAEGLGTLLKLRTLNVDWALGHPQSPALKPGEVLASHYGGGRVVGVTFCRLENGQERYVTGRPEPGLKLLPGMLRGSGTAHRALSPVPSGVWLGVPTIERTSFLGRHIDTPKVQAAVL